ncbi:MAG: 50S ribosomal protein L10 [Amoebophilaceae bacterium]|jgi:large subunit ribosomal protein L10|nr:50S ribosomal protein L10 [Amoebophilaceae bacterium]
MTRKEKSRILEALVARLSSTDYFYVVNTEGLNAEEVGDFRKECFQAGVVYQVVKNTLIGKALEKLGSGVDYSAFRQSVLQGFSGILFAKDTGSIPAKIIKDFRSRRKLEVPRLKGASIDKELFVGEQYLDDLSQLKSRTELLGELIGLLKSPVTRVMASIHSSTHQLAGLVQALAEKRA